MNTNNIIEFIANKVTAAYHAYPVVVEESPEDTETLCVQVFAVPPPRVREVKNFIHDLQDEFGDALGVVLLPMVKNLEVTRNYYPQYAPVEFPVMVAAYGGFIEKQDKGYTMTSGFSGAAEPIFTGAYGIDYRLQQIPCKTAAEFHPMRSQETTADTELALAA